MRSELLPPDTKWRTRAAATSRDMLPRFPLGRTEAMPVSRSHAGRGGAPPPAGAAVSTQRFRDLALRGRKRGDIADGVGAKHQHREPIDTKRDAGAGRQAFGESTQELLVQRIYREATVSPRGKIVFKPRPLLDGVGQLA